jgi:hypothetical protein
MLPSRCRLKIRLGNREWPPRHSGQTMPTEVEMRIGSVLLIIWLITGGVAAGQRGDYKDPIGNCSRAGTIAVTVLAGPLNYAGVSPNINCTVPQPSS